MISIKELIILILMNEDWKRMFFTAGKLLEDSCEMISELDSVIGDKDHWVNVKKIAYILEIEAEDWEKDESFKSFLKRVGYKIMNIKGGTEGPLWGTLFTGFSIGVKDEEGVSENDLKNMFEAAFQYVSELTDAKPGDKTMMDAFIPAVNSILKSNADILNMLSDAAKAAKEGAEETVNYAAEFGRAKPLKDRSLGHKDPGAVSISLLLEGFAEGTKNINRDLLIKDLERLD